jgi:transposase
LAAGARRSERGSLDLAHRSTVEGLAESLSAVSDLPPQVSAVGCEGRLAPSPCRPPARPVRTWWSRGRRVLHRRNVRPCEKRGDDVGKCRAGNATKVMALADSNGLPLSVVIAAGNRHDVVLTGRTLDATFVAHLPPRLIGDKAWDSGLLQARLAGERNVELIAPKRCGKRPSRRHQDRRSLRRYRRRWRVEALFAGLKRMRRLATRWERKAQNFLGLLHLGCAVILLRSRCRT